MKNAPHPCGAKKKIIDRKSKIVYQLLIKIRIGRQNGNNIWEQYFRRKF